MGYSHNWGWLEKPGQEELELCTSLLASFFERHREIVGHCQLNESHDQLILDAPGCETFAFPGHMPEDAEDSLANGIKTLQYSMIDMVIMAALLIARQIFGQGIEIYSDAYWHYEWMHGPRFNFGTRRASLPETSPIALVQPLYLEGNLLAPWPVRYPDMNLAHDYPPARMTGMILQAAGIFWEVWPSREGCTAFDLELPLEALQAIELLFPHVETQPLTVSRRTQRETYYECKVRLPVDPRSTDAAYYLGHTQGAW